MKKGEPYGPEPPHGTHKRYVSRYFKCRCDACKEANKKYMEEYRLRRSNNRGQPLRVDARRDGPRGIARTSSQFTNTYIGDTNG